MGTLPRKVGMLCWMAWSTTCPSLGFSVSSSLFQAAQTECKTRLERLPVHCLPYQELLEESYLKEKLFQANGGSAFSLTEDRKVYITQKDIRELQLAKGAIRTAIEVLLDEVGVPWGEIDKVSLAGNFGAGMDIEAETRIGLLPQIDPAKVDVVGNAALRGASLALMSRIHRDLAVKIPSSCTFLELAGRPDFQNRFADSLLF